MKTENGYYNSSYDLLAYFGCVVGSGHNGGGGAWSDPARVCLCGGVGYRTYIPKSIADLGYMKYFFRSGGWDICHY